MSCGMIRYEDIKQLHIELTSKCNASCPGCPRNFNGGFSLPWLDKAEWTFEQFKEHFSPEFLAQQQFILFCGDYGDPGVCKDLIEIINYIKTHNWNHTVRIHTNGGMRTPEFWGSLAKVMNPSVDMVIFSIDGLEDTNHLYRRGVIWDKLMSNVKAYIDNGGRATWEYLIFGHNEHQIEEARTLAKDTLGFNDFYTKKAFGFVEERHGDIVNGMAVFNKKGSLEYIIPTPSEEKHRNQMMEKQEIKRVVKDPVTWQGEASVTEFTKRFKYNKERTKQQIQEGHMSWLDQKKNIDCMSIRNKEIYIDAQGGVHPCCFLGHASQDADGIVNLQYREWIEENIGLDSINIFKVGSIEAVVNGGYFDKIKDTWSIATHAEGRIGQCTKHCAIEHNPVQELYSELRTRD